MAPPIVNAQYFIRHMRGETHAHLLQANDGNFYVTKFSNNPQGVRVLINEFLGAAILARLDISSPSTVLVRVGDDYSRTCPDRCLHPRHRFAPVKAGLHFGSRFPGDPTKVAAYDFMPVPRNKVRNATHFVGVFAFDKWTANLDSRQAVFFRATHSSICNAEFEVQMIDNGCLFDGPHWRFTESAVQGLCGSTDFLVGVTGLRSFEPWLSRIVNFPEDILHAAVSALPKDWTGGEERALGSLIERLLRRRARVPDLIDFTCKDSLLFPAWGD